MATQDSSQTPPGLLARIAHNSARAGTTGWVLGVVLVFVVAGFCAWILTPGPYTQRVPGDEALGTPAVGNFKAVRDHEIVDEDATRDLRERAAAAELPVYAWDEGAPEEAASRIRGAFGLMRAGLRDARPRRGDARHRDSGEARAAGPLRAGFEARLGVRLADADFAALVESRFAASLEDELVSLTERGLSGPVIDDRHHDAEGRARALVVRSVRRVGPQRDQAITDASAIRDVETARADVDRAAAALAQKIPPAQLAAIGHVAGAMVRPTLLFDLAETTQRKRDAADRVKPVVVRVKRGEKIVGDGEVIEKRHLVVFRGIRGQTRTVDVVLVRLGAAALLALLVVLLWRHARRNVSGFHPTRKDAVLLASALLVTGALAAAGLAVGDALHDRFPALSPETLYYLVPFAVGAMVIRSVLSAEIALLFAVASGALVGLVAGNSLFLAMHSMLTSVVASGLVARTRDRSGLFKVGAAVGGIGALLVLATHLFTGRGVAEVAAPAAAAAVGGAVLMPVMAIGILPLVEWVFGYLTDVKLLELANLNHPALKDLIVQAPGTYHHSVIVGSLVEAAAQAIGANALLARVAAYYHDLGKTRNPGFFAENQRNDNRHEALAASMSALIVKRHVTDGLELARHWRLPRAVMDVIAQHHGTRLVSFFWAKAQQRARAAGEGNLDPALEETLYRYPGPKPQTREAALVMIADACEASARALAEPDAERLRALVNKRINEIFGEGQLDDCALTLRDLNSIAAAMVRALEAVYHSRPEYPRREAPPRESAETTPAVPLQLVGTAERRRP